MRIILFIIIILLGTGAVLYLIDNPLRPNSPEVHTEVQKPLYSAKKVLYINSYDSSYIWSRGIEDALEKSLSQTEVTIKKYYLKTKTVNKSESNAKKAGIEAQKLLNSFKPDVVIVSDDNAYKHVVIDSINSSIPFVFCGVNYHAEGIDSTTKNITGMLEVDLNNQLIDLLKKYGKGNRVGFIGEDVESNRVRLENIINYHKIPVEKSYLISSIEEWKKQFIAVQKEVDILYIASFQSLPSYNQQKIKAFVDNNTTIPTGSTNDFLADFSLVSFAKESSEQGEWAAAATMEILSGKSPSEIPITRNSRAKIILNMNLAKKLGIIFSVDMIEDADLISKK